MMVIKLMKLKKKKKVYNLNPKNMHKINAIGRFKCGKFIRS